ncbi:hypothetical protein D9758_005483 [Tetrapyrgos nigripes]|uniref:NAD(P)-binding protein n=1 Tax=Tetrapyrgos nigripes TaxID=182062 RepID=A0A8H5LQ16_9AGAR|nr:hypothetical protein D9758_005483 [Tetrapyrgos nigripes]
MPYSLPRFSDILAFFKQAYFIPAPKWGPEKMPDMTGKVVIVTGGSAGIGKLTVKALLEKNAIVYLAARNPSKSQAVIDELAKSTGKNAIFLHIDLADLHSVKKATEEFLRGVMVPPKEQLTTQGYDLQFGTNVLGHFYLTKLLLPTLLSTTEQTPNSEKVRIVNLSSSAPYLMRYKFDFGSLIEGPARKRQSSGDLYMQSKFGNLVFAKELARRYGDNGIVSTAVNPGNLKTELSRHASVFEKFGLRFLQIYSPELGCLTQLWAGTSPEGAQLNGKFLVPWCREGRPRTGSDDSELAVELWRWMEEQVEKIERGEC